MRWCLPLILGATLGAAAPPPAPVYDDALKARVFDRAWRLVDQHYWDRERTGEAWQAARDRFRPRVIAARDRRAVYTLLGEMLASLGDSHVYAIDPVQVRIAKAHDAGAADEGFGFTMLPDEDAHWRVTQVRPGSSAARAGVEIGWEVARVNGAEVDIDFEPAEAEQARFDFIDEHNVHHDVRLSAELEEPAPARRAQRLPGDILLVALDGFDRGDDAWLADALAQGHPPAGVILDLRANEGGDADVIARVAGLFFAQDRPLVRRIARNETVQRTRGAGSHSWRGPLAVLVGPDSASGAEALAALIDESGRGETIGQRTAGALTGAALYRLPDKGELWVAEFDIRTPAGTRLEGVGFTPRIAVAPTLADRRAGRDPVLDRARHLLAAQARR